MVGKLIPVLFLNTGDHFPSFEMKGSVELQKGNRHTPDPQHYKICILSTRVAEKQTRMELM